MHNSNLLPHLALSESFPNHFQWLMCNYFRSVSKSAGEKLSKPHVPQGFSTLSFATLQGQKLCKNGSVMLRHVWERGPMHICMTSALEVRVCAARGGGRGPAVNTMNPHWPRRVPVVLCDANLRSCNNHVTGWVCSSCLSLLLRLISTADWEPPSFKLNTITLGLLFFPPLFSVIFPLTLTEACLAQHQIQGALNYWLFIMTQSRGSQYRSEYCCTVYRYWQSTAVPSSSNLL